MNNSLNNKILEKIKNEGIEPRPHWQFILKEISLWIGTIISLLLASIAVGSFIFQSANTMIIPPEIQIWFGAIRIIVIILFVILAIYQVLRIGRGYKRTKQMYVITGLVIIGIIGSLFVASRVTGRIESKIGSTGLIEQAQHYWSKPLETGLLAGELFEVTNDGYIIFTSLDGGTHIIDAQFIPEEEQNIFLEFLRVKMVGYEQDGIFYPCSLSPWKVWRMGIESHKEYKGLRDGNLQFGNEKQVNNSFNHFFERKDSILRTNQCQLR